MELIANFDNRLDSIQLKLNELDSLNLNVEQLRAMVQDFQINYLKEHLSNCEEEEKEVKKQLAPVKKSKILDIIGVKSVSELEQKPQ